jgi:hypothetical protein
MPLLLNPADTSLLVGWMVAQVITGGVLFMALRWAQKKDFNKGLETRITTAVNTAVAAQVGDLKAHVADVRELVQRTVEIQTNILAATAAMTKLGDRFEALYAACPLGIGNVCKLSDSVKSA